MAESEITKALYELEDRFVIADTAAQAIWDAVGDNGPPWVYMHWNAIKELEQALEQLSVAYRKQLNDAT